MSLFSSASMFSTITLCCACVVPFIRSKPCISFQKFDMTPVPVRPQ